MTTPLCSICQYEIYPIESINILLCDHVFHKLCILDWFKTKFNCPICRFTIYDKSSSSNTETNTYIPLTNDVITIRRRFHRSKCIIIGSIVYIGLILLMGYFNMHYDFNFNNTKY